MPLSEEMQAALTKAGLPLDTITRRQRQGRRRQDARHDGGERPQQAYMANVAAKVRAMFKARNKPFVLACSGRAILTAATQHRRQPQQRDARYQRPDSPRRHQECRR